MRASCLPTEMTEDFAAVQVILDNRAAPRETP